MKKISNILKNTTRRSVSKSLAKPGFCILIPQNLEPEILKSTSEQVETFQDKFTKVKLISYPIEEMVPFPKNNFFRENNLQRNEELREITKRYVTAGYQDLLNIMETKKPRTERNANQEPRMRRMKGSGY
mgnify:CR=1 FL=1